VSHAFWYCNCRHPGTKVYYADEMEKRQALYDELRSIFEEMKAQRDNWKQLYLDARDSMARHNMQRIVT
jgi:hypothetical protein